MRHATARDWMSRFPVIVAPDITVAEARGVIETHGFRDLPVVDGGRVVGIISDRGVGIQDTMLQSAVRDGRVQEDRQLVGITSVDCLLAALNQAMMES